MTKRVAVAMLVLFGTLVGLVLLTSLANREPKYQGRPLSHWFKKYYRAQWGSREEREERKADRALRAIGTNAVPWLVAQALTTDQNSQLETNVLGFLGKLPFFPPFVSADQTRWSAWNAVVVIKPPASLLLPLVTNRFDSYDKDQRQIAVGILDGISDGAEAAVPFLRERLRSDDFMLRLLACRALEQCGPAARAATGDLIEILRNPGAGRQMHYHACLALAGIGPDASNAIPVLKERLANDTNVWTRIENTRALCRIDSREAEALEWLIEQIKGAQNRNERSQMIRILGEIGPNAKVAAPFLRELAHDLKQQIWHPAVVALLRIGETNLAFGEALKKLNEDGFHTRLEAAKLILAAQPTNAAAMATLIDLMKDSFSGYEAIKAVGNLGVAGKPAIPALREVVNGGYPSHYRQAARLALKDINTASEEALTDR